MAVEPCARPGTKPAAVRLIQVKALVGRDRRFAMRHAAYYRELAAQCQVLAALTLDQAVRDRLLLLAEEYESDAARLDGEPEAEPPMPGPDNRLPG